MSSHLHNQELLNAIGNHDAAAETFLDSRHTLKALWHVREARNLRRKYLAECGIYPVQTVNVRHLLGLRDNA